MAGSPWAGALGFLWDGSDEYGASRHRVHDHHTAVAHDRFIGPGGEGLGATADRQQDLAGPVGRDRDSDPPDLPEQAFLRTHGHVPPASVASRRYWYTTAAGRPLTALCGPARAQGRRLTSWSVQAGSRSGRLPAGRPDHPLWAGISPEIPAGQEAVGKPAEGSADPSVPPDGVRGFW